MNIATREHLTADIDAATLKALRNIAEREGLPLTALVEEALVDLVKKREHAQVRAEVMSAYEGSHQEFAPLYKKLAERLSI